ncbi:MAG: helicase-related protein, partial [Myxococcota bacterium]
HHQTSPRSVHRRPAQPRRPPEAPAQRPVLITTPTQALVDQLAATVSQHCGPMRVGRAYQHAWELERDLVVACVASLPRVLEARSSWACWIADEAHRIEGPSTRLVSRKLQSQVAVGFTATPFRADDRGLQTWDRVVYAYTSHDAVRDGVLVPFRVVRAEAADDVDDLTERWVQQAQGPGIVSALTVDDAEALASRLGALAIHGRQSQAERQRRINALRSGAVPCLVHVQLLTEGVDLPWLKWLVLRRPVKSPVRLVQEVGRVLRCAPGKTEAVLYDPHDLLGHIGLVHATTLEDVQRGTAESEGRDVDGMGRGWELSNATPVHPLAGWATDLLGALRAANIADPAEARWSGEAGWRYRPVSAKQAHTLERCLWATQYLKWSHSRTVRELARTRALRAGTASELLDVMFALVRHRRKVESELLPTVPRRSNRRGAQR